MLTLVNGVAVSLRICVDRQSVNSFNYISYGDEDGEYASEELGSSGPYDIITERHPKYEKFIRDLLNNDYEFKLGMEFNSLIEFKDFIRD